MWPELQLREGQFSRKNRLCKSCSAGEIEDEAHILLSCSAFTDKRSAFFQSIESLHSGFISFDDQHKLEFLLSDLTVSSLTASFLHDVYNARL